MATKKDESTLLQQKMASKKEDPSKAQKMASKKEEPSQAHQKMEEPSQAQQRMMPKRDEREPSQGNQGDASTAAAPPGPASPTDNLNSRSGNSANSSSPIVLKSGPLFLSSKGIGWTSWKKRWFILTHTSLVFFRSDPNAVSQKGNEVNLTLGGIDLNNSGSVVVKADKKLITVLFQDGRDGRTFTLKAETLDDLYEWKAALEKALSQAPSSALSAGQNGIFGNDQAEAVDGPKEPVNDKQPVRSSVLHRPILLALEDVDGAPTFLEKALRFVEEHGVKVEGILRQAADVEDVERRIREYEQGKIEFSPDEDAHVIADCVKYVIRELPSSPVPASCCNALLEACRTEHSARVNAMRMAVLDTFPEPNRRLLQRILNMMQIVASHKNENRMSSSAVAACMAPLLLRPLLSGDCEIESDFDVGGDGSMQLLQAAAAANHAQAICITLLEEYDKIFGEGCVSPDMYSDSEESGSGSEEEADDDESDEDDEDYEDDECDDESQGSDEDDDYAESGTGSEGGHSVKSDDKDYDSSSSSSESSKSGNYVQATKKKSSPLHPNDGSKGKEDNRISKSSETDTNKPAELSKGVHGVTKLEDTSTRQNSITSASKPLAVGNGPGLNVRQGTMWRRSSGSKKLSMDSIDYPIEEEAAVESLEAEKLDLQKRLTEEIESNTILEANLEKRKKALHEQRLALEKEVARLEEELQRAREKRTALEAGLNPSQGSTSLPEKIDEKTKEDLKDIARSEADVRNLNKRVNELGTQLNQQPEQKSVSMSDSCTQREPNHQTKMKDKIKGAEAPMRSRSKKEMKVDKAEGEKGKKQESSMANKHKNLVQQEMDVDKAESEKGKKQESSTANKHKNPVQQETNVDKAESEKGKKQESFTENKQKNLLQQETNVDKVEPEKGKKQESSTANKHSPQNQQLDHSTHDSKPTSAAETVSHKRHTRSNSKKSSTRVEERRSQAANETHGKEKSCGSSHGVSSSSSDKGKGPEAIQSVKNPGKGRGSDISQ
ncbi:rho GTPase-activating protein REN1-like isoform X1 [Gossypium arboreum]|uniref:rho GTPase-activating protein REN1-like isoform X1 n=1 Tax=Gossypium arboreum TaxID=29729 RepID=UPI00081969D4|nr:rho GTPase-activating protein REN1-like isoform X1 [Gossypium arboreum]XP_052883887.1 rho GTPase-activating protein REN1-like isoform X1 [Gossypium arboreum]